MNQQEYVQTGGLTKFYSKVYGFVGLGVAISAVTAYLASTVFWYQVAPLLSNRIMFFGLWIAQLALVVNLSKNAVQEKGNSLVGYIGYSVLTGITLSVTLKLYTAESITAAFLTASVTFAVMAVVGVVIKKDLSAVGHALYSLVLGIIIASLLNFFILKSSPVEMFISYAMVLVFSGLVAYDNQKIKAIYYQAGVEPSNNIAIYCALSLYLDLINLFYAFLRIFGRD